MSVGEEQMEQDMFQEEFGEVFSSTLLGPAFVFSQHWPSWAFAVDALGALDITTVVEWRNAIAREEFRATSLGHTLCSRADAIHRLQSADKLMPPLVFIQGDVSFLDSCLSLLDDTAPYAICASLRNADGSCLSPKSVRHVPSLHWRMVSHKSMAGVTTGQWLFGSSINLASFGGLQTSPLRRNLHHVLKSTVRGGVSPSVGITRFRNLPICASSTRAPVGQKHFAVTTKSVFIPAGNDNTVVREVALSELMDIYDLEVTTQVELETFWSSSAVTPSREFVYQTPVKALFSPASQVLRALAMSSASASSPSADVDIDVPDILLQSDLPSPPAGTFGMEPDSPTSSSRDPSPSTTPSIKAAKNDDAEVNVRDWDIWAVDNYHPPSPADAPKICIKGSYSPATARCFNLLRRCMLKAYKRRLLRGFLLFLNKEHDAGRRVPFDVTYPVQLKGKGGGKSFISATVMVSPWCLSPLRKKVPRCDKHHPNDDLIRDLTKGIDCLERAGFSTFWEWKDGSSIFFWRWPSRYKRALRDGSKLFVNKKHLPKFTDKQRLPKDPETRKKLLDKLQVPRSKRYIAPGLVWSRTGYFDVPKGENDIRIVYDATACGLNRALWSPNFYLPTVDSLLRNADADTFYGDIDLGEMFLNYMLDEAIRPYAGVDVSALEPEKIKQGMKAVIERWERTLMGLRSSPYVCTQMFSWSEEVIRGNRLEKGNPLRWDRVVLNLPGDENYDPSKPRVYKWNSETNTMAGLFGTYVDDIRTQHQSETLCRGVTRRVASGVGYLGQQDAPRKRRPPCQRPGAWSGAMCFSVKDEGLYVTCSQEKWDKGRKLISELYRDVVESGVNEISRSRLEKHVGFLVHLSRTFPAIFPYLKGIYLTMESWRVGRDDEGWKFSRKAWWNLMAGALDVEEEEDVTPTTFEEKRREYLRKHQGERPHDVKVVTRLGRDLSCLMRLFAHDKPPKRLVRGRKLQEAIYSFGDASGGGFGSSWEKDGKIKYRAGTWGADMSDESSNHRELRNLVDSLYVMEKEGTLPGTEAFIFTDNSTAESAFYKGTSSSPKLFELVMRLRELEMRAGCKIHLIHVSGNRMIAQGSDGLSRGNFTEGSMRGKSIFEFIPLSKTALDRSPALLDWLKDWTGEKDLEVLDPVGWFERGHDLLPDGEKNAEGHWIPSFKAGKFVWVPPPAAAEVAIEELRKARHKRQDSYHIFLVPRLMKPLWHKQLCKASDIVLTLPIGHSVWPTSMHEPLTIGLCFPYLKYRPWELKRTGKILGLGRALHKVWKEDGDTERHLLRELWGLPRKLERMPQVLARKVLQGVPDGALPHCGAGKRRRHEMDEEKGRGKIPKR